MWVLMPAGAEALLVLALWYTALPASWCQRARVAGTMLVPCWIAALGCRSTCRLHITGLQPLSTSAHAAPQGVPSVARAAAVTGIHDPALLEVSKPCSVLAGSCWQACHEVLLVQYLASQVPRRVCLVAAVTVCNLALLQVLRHYCCCVAHCCPHAALAHCPCPSAGAGRGCSAGHAAAVSRRHLQHCGVVFG